MNTITQAIVNRSTLEVLSIKITNATKDSFIMSMESKVANTGPISSLMSAMDLDMAGPSGIFGRLHLPELKTSPSGTTVTVTDQLIHITDMAAFIAFVRAVMCEESLVLKLENGQATIKVFGLVTAHVAYSKDVLLKGMNGPPTTMTKTEVDGAAGGCVNEMTAFNPSPLELDLGTVRYEIRDGKGVKLAEQKGRIYFERGETTYVMRGTVTGAIPEGDARIVGLGVEEDNWHNATIPFLDAPLTLADEFVTLCTLNT